MIAKASAAHRSVDPAAFALMVDAARKAPLAPEPFLVRGVQAQVAGDGPRAGAAFAAAELRDGRSLPARYFLAEHYFRTGDAGHGLAEIAYLARAIPNGVASLAPYVAAYARDPRNRSAVMDLFRSEPGLGDASLGALAADPSNAALVESLGSSVPMALSPTWPARLIASLVDAGQYEKAHAIWADKYRTGGQTDLVFDPDFRGSDAPPPFNWSLASSRIGVAERRGGLHVVYYGQEDGALADQLLLLKPGAYRLSMRVAGGPSGSQPLAWTIACANSKESIGRFPLDPQRGRQEWTFTVPGNCPAQQLTLIGSTGDTQQQSDVTVSGLKLEPVNG